VADHRPLPQEFPRDSLMALMRLLVLRFRDLNFKRFAQQGGEGRYPQLASALTSLTIPVFAT